MMPNRRLRSNQAKKDLMVAGLMSDNSWQRFTFCRICNRRMCVNNYADRKVRLPKVRGVIVCSTCKFGRSAAGKGDGADFVTAMFKLTEHMAHQLCKRIPVDQIGNPDVDLLWQCGKCPSCAARKVMAKSPAARRETMREERNDASISDR